MNRVFIGFSDIYDGSCALGDDPRDAKRKTGETNRQKLIERFKLNAHTIVTPRPDWQEKRIHEVTADTLTAPERPAGECLITKMPNVPIGMHGADCLSVLFTDMLRTVVAAAHVPRCSLTDTFLDRVVDAIRQRTDSPLEAYLGPCLQKQSHTFDADEALDMVVQRPDIRPFISNEVDRKGYIWTHLDYSGYAEHRLKNLGVSIAFNEESDTYTSPLYFSNRQAAYDNGKNDVRSGLHLAVVALEPLNP